MIRSYNEDSVNREGRNRCYRHRFHLYDPLEAHGIQVRVEAWHEPLAMVAHDAGAFDAVLVVLEPGGRSGLPVGWGPFGTLFALADERFLGTMCVQYCAPRCDRTRQS